LPRGLGTCRDFRVPVEASFLRLLEQNFAPNQFVPDMVR
jgi:hypothetical protein